jgi:hypothetical protein
LQAPLFAEHLRLLMANALPLIMLEIRPASNDKWSWCVIYKVMQNRLSRNGWEDCYSYRKHVTEWNTTDMGLLQHTVAYGSETSGCYSLGCGKE